MQALVLCPCRIMCIRFEHSCALYRPVALSVTPVAQTEATGYNKSLLASLMRGGTNVEEHYEQNYPTYGL